MTLPVNTKIYFYQREADRIVGWIGIYLWNQYLSTLMLQVWWCVFDTTFSDKVFQSFVAGNAAFYSESSGFLYQYK